MPAAVTVAIRRATEDDVASLTDAHRLAQAAVEDARGGRLDTLLRGRAEPIDATFSNDLNAEDTEVYVGTANSVFAGYSVATTRTLRTGETILELTDLWVHPELRGIGVGAALMNNALDSAAATGCTGIDARALPGDRQTKNFFESFGLVARTIEVHRSL